MTRRQFLAAASSSLAAAAEPFPVVDFHAHIEDPAEIDQAVKQSSARGVKLGILWHAGKKEYDYPFMLSDDAALGRFFALIGDRPVFKGIQAEGPDWMTCFSKSMIARLDYVLTDAVTFRERDGRMVKLWTKGVDVGDPQDFMDRYIDWHVETISREPIDIMANLGFLPEYLMPRFDALWTEKRSRKVIDAAAKSGVAIEINSRYNLPKRSFLEMAKAAGVRFSFGSNAHGLATGNLEYSLATARELNLEKRHLFTPAPKGKKPIERRG
ncbi:MAG: hypothetical protein ACKV22_24025 [Bryobacteraceae bacterium]